MKGTKALRLITWISVGFFLLNLQLSLFAQEHESPQVEIVGEDEGASLKIGTRKFSRADEESLSVLEELIDDIPHQELPLSIANNALNTDQSRSAMSIKDALQNRFREKVQFFDHVPGTIEAISQRVPIEHPAADPQTSYVERIFLPIADEEDARAAEGFVEHAAAKRGPETSLQLVTVENPALKDVEGIPDDVDLFKDLRKEENSTEVRANLAEPLSERSKLFLSLYYKSLVLTRVLVNGTLVSIAIQQEYGLSPSVSWPAFGFAAGVTFSLQVLNNKYELWINSDKVLGLLTDPSKNSKKYLEEVHDIQRKSFLGKTVYEGKKLIKEYILYTAIFHGYWAAMNYAGIGQDYSIAVMQKAIGLSLFAETGAILAIFKTAAQAKLKAKTGGRLAYLNARTATWVALFSMMITTPQMLATGDNPTATYAITGIAAASWIAYTSTFISPMSILKKVGSKIRDGVSKLGNTCGLSFRGSNG